MADLYADLRASQDSDCLPVFIARNPDGTILNLTGYTASFKAREAPGAVPVLSLTSSSGITLGGAAGTIVPRLARSLLGTVAHGRYYYDLVLVDGAGTARQFLEGMLWVSPGWSS